MCDALLASYAGKRVRVQSGNLERELERHSIAALAKRKEDLKRQINRLGGTPGVASGAIRVGVPTP